MSEPKEPSPFEKFRALAQKVATTPKKEVDAREERWKEQRKTAKDQKKSA